MKIIAISILLVTLVSQALAEQSAIEQALSQKILAELNAGLACSTKLIETQKQLDEAHARLKELESKAKSGAPPS